MNHTLGKIKVKGQFVQTIEWKQTDGQTDTSDRINFPANAVSKYTSVMHVALTRIWNHAIWAVYMGCLFYSSNTMFNWLVMFADDS